MTRVLPIEDVQTEYEKFLKRKSKGLVTERFGQYFLNRNAPSVVASHIFYEEDDGEAFRKIVELFTVPDEYYYGIAKIMDNLPHGKCRGFDVVMDHRVPDLRPVQAMIWEFQEKEPPYEWRWVYVDLHTGDYLGECMAAVQQNWTAPQEGSSV